MRYSGRPSRSAKASKYSISAASAQAKARRREAEAGYKDVPPSTTYARDELLIPTAEDPRKKRRSGYYDSVTDRLRPKIYHGKQALSQLKPSEDGELKFDKTSKSLNGRSNPNSIAKKQKPQWLEEAIAPEFSLKRSREENDEPQEPRSYRTTDSPHKKPRCTTQPSITPTSYATPLRHIPEPFLPRKSYHPNSGSYTSISPPVQRSPTSGYGSGFSFNIEPRALRFERKMQPSISPTPVRFGSNFVLPGRFNGPLRLEPSSRLGQGGDPFGTPRRTIGRPVNSPHLFRPIYVQHHTSRSFTPFRSGFVETPISSYYRKDSDNEVLPFSLPYRRDQSYTDVGRKAQAMAFQPSMPIIAEESELGEETVAQLYSEPRTLTPSPIWNQGAQSHSFHFGDSRDPYFNRSETPIQTQLASDHSNPWEARSNTNMICSQSSASRNENRAPSETSVASLPIYAPKALLGINIEALELAARSPSVDEVKDRSGLQDLKAAGSTEHPISASQGDRISTDVVKRVPSSVLSFTKPDTMPFPQSSQGNKQNQIKRPVPKRRKQNIPAPVFPVEHDLVKPIDPPPYKFYPASPVAGKAKRIPDMEEIESIGSFEDEVASASDGKTAVAGDPASIDLMEQNTVVMKSEQTSSTDMERESEISLDLPIGNDTKSEIEEHQGYPGFDIWRDESP